SCRSGAHSGAQTWEQNGGRSASCSPILRWSLNGSKDLLQYLRLVPLGVYWKPVG
ncbi:hypothetical protein scyTo_0011042, partial [Scyliorhinus torazame]|nr:hypothetical protein [Scyliorhinus torazame]